MSGLGNSIVVILAEGNPGQGSLLDILPMLVLMFLAAYFLLIRPQSRERKNHAAMLADLKRNDHVLTYSGFYGTVVDIQRDVDRVRLRIDDTNNVRVTVTLGSIAKIIKVDGGDDKSDTAT